MRHLLERAVEAIRGADAQLPGEPVDAAALLVEAQQAIRRALVALQAEGALPQGERKARMLHALQHDHSASVAEIAERYGYSASAARKLAAAHGLRRRRSGPVGATPSGPAVPPQVILAALHGDPGATHAEIAHRLGVSRSWVSRLAMQHGIRSPRG